MSEFHSTFLQFAKFLCVQQKKARFGNILRIDEGLVSQVILPG